MLLSDFSFKRFDYCQISDNTIRRVGSEDSIENLIKINDAVSDVYICSHLNFLGHSICIHGMYENHEIKYIEKSEELIKFYDKRNKN